MAKGAARKSINAHVQTTPQNAQHPIYAVLWTRDHKQIFTASFDRTVKLWDVATGNLVREFKAAPGPVPIEPKKVEPKKVEPKKEDKTGPKKVDPKLAAEFLRGLVRGDPPLPPGPPGQGIVWGWLIPGVLFVIMGIAPVLAVLPIGQSGRSGRARERIAYRVAPRGGRAPSKADYQRLANDLRAVEDQTEDAQDLVSKLERLAAMRESGALTRDEYEQAKRALLIEVQTT